MKKIIIIGCGAISQKHHIPSLLKNSAQILLCDKNPDVLDAKLKKYPFSTNFMDFLNEADGALIATNHTSHFKIAKNLAENNVNVLIEKPITTSLDDCKQLIKFENKISVGAGYFRRYVKNFNLLKEIIQNHKLGVVKKIEIEEGGVYGWPAMSNAFWKKESSGGGVLMDTGSHSIDLVHFLLGKKLQLIKYEDDALDGIEVNCEIQLQCEDIAISIELTRNKPTLNQLKVYFENFYLTFNITNGELVENNLENEEFQFSAAEYPDDTFYNQISIWLDSFTNPNNKLVKASCVKDTVELIEDCYNFKKNV